MTDKPIANPLIVLRVESDDWAILFDPDTSDGFTINPVGVLIWKKLDGKHTVEDIIKEIKEKFQDVEEDVESHCKEFIEELVNTGLAGYEVQKV